MSTINIYTGTSADKTVVMDLDITNHEEYMSIRSLLEEILDEVPRMEGISSGKYKLHMQLSVMAVK